jgi:hypothetical protein
MFSQHPEMAKRWAAETPDFKSLPEHVAKQGAPPPPRFAKGGIAEPKHWIAGAIKHPGALRKKAETAGESTHEFAEEHQHDPGTTGHQARLGLTLMRMEDGGVIGESEEERRRRLLGQDPRLQAALPPAPASPALTPGPPPPVFGPAPAGPGPLPPAPGLEPAPEPAPTPLPSASVPPPNFIGPPRPPVFESAPAMEPRMPGVQDPGLPATQADVSQMPGVQDPGLAPTLPGAPPRPRFTAQIPLQEKAQQERQAILAKLDEKVPTWRKALAAVLSVSPRLHGISAAIGGPTEEHRQQMRAQIANQMGDDERALAQQRALEGYRNEQAETNRINRESQATTRKEGLEDRKLKILTTPQLEEITSKSDMSTFSGTVSIGGKQYGVIKQDVMEQRKRTADAMAARTNMRPISEQDAKEKGLLGLPDPEHPGMVLVNPAEYNQASVLGQRTTHETEMERPPSEREWRVSNKDRIARGLTEQSYAEYQNEDANRKKPVTNIYAGTPLSAAQASKTGEDFLAALSPQDRNIVKGLTDYKINPTTLSARQNERARVVALASQYDPTYDQTQFPVRQKTRIAFASGPESQQIKAINTVIGHINDLKSAGARLDNRSFQLWNALANRMISAVDDPRVNNFEIAATGVEAELTRVFQGSAPMMQEIKQWRERLNSSNGPEKLKGSVKTALSLVGSRMGALREQYETAMGKPLDFHLLNPRSHKILTRMGVDPRNIDPNLTGGQESPASSGAPAGGGEVITTPDGKKWRREGDQMIQVQ